MSSMFVTFSKRLFLENNIMSKRGLIVCSFLMLGGLTISACSKGVSHDEQPQSQTESNTAVVSNSPAPTAKPNPPAMTPGGDPVDLTELNGKVATAEKNLNSSDDASRVELAHAYLARASALTKARQYRSALGDYRRTLKYDPQNKEATDMSAMITGILKDMNIPVPPEGQEPPPKPLTDAKQASESKAY